MTDVPDDQRRLHGPDDGTGRDAPGNGASGGAPDEGVRDGAPGEATPYDDDRLLAYALGLEDDAELEAALATDDGLGRRLEALRAGLDDVGAGLERLVPAPDETYADPAAARWDGLRPFFAPPPERRPARRSLFGRWRVLVPVIGAILAVALVGAFALRDGPVDTRTASEEAGTLESAGDSVGAPAAEADGVKGTYSAKDLAADLEMYETAFVARAGEAADGRQRFTVVRQIKGTVTGDVYLEVVDQPIPAETLTLVMLGAGPLGAEGATPTPAPTAPDAEALQRIRATAFLTLDAAGVQAVVIPLPSDVDLDGLLP